MRFGAGAEVTLFGTGAEAGVKKVTPITSGCNEKIYARYIFQYCRLSQNPL